MRTHASEEIVLLRGGLCVPLSALRLAIDLECRGVSMRIDGDDLVLSPAAEITPAEAHLLQKHLAAVKDILRYVAPGIM